MITIKNVRTLTGDVEEITVEGEVEQVIDAKGKLLLLPGLIDIHVHFRTPGAEHKENWVTGAKAAIYGGITTVFDMPNNQPPTIDLQSLRAKEKLIDEQLARSGIPLRYHLYVGADKEHIEALGQAKKHFVGIKVYMGSSTGGLVMDDIQALERVFQLGAQQNIMISVHAEDEKRLKERYAVHHDATDPQTHSLIRDRQAAINATTQAISLAQKYNTELLIHHVSTKEEVELIRAAKKKHLLVYGEACPHHLFLSEEDYRRWGTKVQVNPPLRTKEDQEALWKGIADGTIDVIATDHAPHTLSEKNEPYGKAPSGIPSIELALPLLLNAVHEKKITIDKIVNLMRINPENIYNLPHNQDVVLVDMEKEKEVRDEELKTKCGWSPYSGRMLKGWPAYTIVKGKLFHLE